MFHGYSKVTPAINATEIIMTLHGDSNRLSQYLPAAFAPSYTAGEGELTQGGIFMRGSEPSAFSPSPFGRGDNKPTSERRGNGGAKRVARGGPRQV
jgi:hypothetical protein